LPWLVSIVSSGEFADKMQAHAFDRRAPSGALSLVCNNSKSSSPETKSAMRQSHNELDRDRTS
jgi:hypothetical protein